MKKAPSRILISVGPTREPLDPVRFISNYSTGTLGLTLARVCKALGHQVTLACSETVDVPASLKVRLRPFDTVLDLKHVLSEEIGRHDVLFMAAAVSDFKPLQVEFSKIKKGKKFLNLSLVENPDILKSLIPLKKNKVYVGFCLESKDVYAKGLEKLIEKNLDLMIAQKVTGKVKPFGPVAIDAIVIDRRGRKTVLKKISKDRLSRLVIERATALL